jgi:hypothetical protein
VIARGNDAAAFGRQGAQQPADAAAVLPAVVGFDDALEAVEAHHPAAEAGGDIDGRHLGRFGGGAWFAGGFLLDDGPPPRQVALRLDALRQRRGVSLVAVLLKVAGPVVVPRRLGAVLAQVDADLLFLGHAGASWRSPPILGATHLAARSCLSTPPSCLDRNTGC